MVTRLVYMPPFLAVERARETEMQNCLIHHCPVQLVMKLIVVSSAGQRIIEGAECVRSENAMQFSHPTTAPASYEPATA